MDSNLLFSFFRVINTFNFSNIIIKSAENIIYKLEREERKAQQDFRNRVLFDKDNFVVKTKEIHIIETYHINLGKILMFQKKSTRESYQILFEIKEAQKTPLTALIGGERAASNLKAHIITLCLIPAYFLIGKLFDFNPSQTLIYIVLIFNIFLYLNQKVLEYRISHGLYGTNEYEARQIIKYAIENEEKIDSNNGGTKVYVTENEVMDLLPSLKKHKETAEVRV